MVFTISRQPTNTSAMPGSTLDPEAVRRAYDRYAAVYDLLYGKVLQPGRNVLARQMQAQPGQKVLEIGVGSGLMLPLYPRHADVMAVDISARMLQKAQQVVDRHNLTHVRLQLMNAELTALPQAAFDHVVLPYVYSVTPRPLHLMQQALRACRPGGSVWILNHFSYPGAWKLLEWPIRPFARWLGFRSDFSYDTYIARQDWDIAAEYKVNLFALSRLIHIRNTAGPLAGNLPLEGQP